MTDVFDRIYRKNLWNGVDSRSGPGSGTAATRRIVPELLALIDEFDVRSVLDVGCGDGFWMPDLPGYVGCDRSAVAIRLARRNHRDRTYVVGLPMQRFDLVICRDALQHLPLEDGVNLIGAIRANGPRLLLASTYLPGWNVDVALGDFYSPDLTAEPFHLPEPDRLIFDGYHYHESDELRDPGKHLGLWIL